MLVRSALIFALATAGCVTSGPDAAPPVAPPATATVGTVRIPLGETVTVESVPVRFDAVTEDSRCPPDVECMWAGRAHVRLTVGGAPVELSVPGYGPNDPVPSEIKRGTLTVRARALTPKAPSAPSTGGPEPLWVEIDATRG